MDTQKLAPLADALISAFEQKNITVHDSTISVNRFISEIATWYEKFRNAMDYREEEVVLRGAVERILKRRLMLGGDGEKIAEPLIRELLWARYFPDGSIPQTIILEVASLIDMYLALKKKIPVSKHITESVKTEWTYQLLSCEIAILLRANNEKDTMSNFMYQIMKDGIKISDDTIDTKNVQVFLAIRRAYAKDDIAFLRYHLVQQLFGQIFKENLDMIATSFSKAYEEIEKQIKYPLKEKMYIYIKKQTPIFFILEDVLHAHKTDIRSLLADQEKFQEVIYNACERRYKTISSKVRRAIVRSVAFLIITKAFLAITIEGTYENIVFGKIMWRSIALNTGIPPLLMIIMALFIKTPGKDNSRHIFERVEAMLFQERPKISYNLLLTVHPKKNKSFLSTVFALLWLCAFLISFGFLAVVLHRLEFNLVSQAIFIFFLTIVSFLSYRINMTAHMYTVQRRQGLLTPFIDFLFLPIIKVGMRLTEGISQINILVFIFDFLIEAPFKGLFHFFEQWFIYLHTKRDDLE